MSVPATVTLTPEQQSQLAQYIDEGRFASVDEAIENALLLLDQTAYATQQLTPGAIDRIQLGLNQLARGEGVSSDQWETEMEQRRSRWNAH